MLFSSILTSLICLKKHLYVTAGLVKQCYVKVIIFSIKCILKKTYSLDDYVIFEGIYSKQTCVLTSRGQYLSVRTSLQLYSITLLSCVVKNCSLLSFGYCNYQCFYCPADFAPRSNVHIDIHFGILSCCPCTVGRRELCCVEVVCWCRGCVWTWLFLVCSWAGPAPLQTLLLWKTLLILQIVSSAAWLMPSNLWPAQIALSLSTPSRRPLLVFTFPASSYCFVRNFPRCFCFCSFLFDSNRAEPGAVFCRKTRREGYGRLLTGQMPHRSCCPPWSAAQQGLDCL